MARLSWKEKLNKLKQSKLVEIPLRMQKRLGKGKMLVPRGLDVDALIRKVAPGCLITQSQIRDLLSKRHKANVTCPITTGIFVRIAAEAAVEEEHLGKTGVTPFWRVVRDDGSLIEKFPGGVKEQARRLRKEGHRISAASGKKPPRVIGFEVKDF